MTRCETHQFDESEGTCRSCRQTFCGQCLVYAQGPQRPPLCIRCALRAGGVRSRRAGARIRG